MVSPQYWDRGYSIFLLSGGDGGGWGWTWFGGAQGPRRLLLYFSFFWGSFCKTQCVLWSGLFQSCATFVVISNCYVNGNAWFLKINKLDGFQVVARYYNLFV
jgi:hypothetical protein